MDKKQLQDWIKDDKFSNKVFKKDITEEEIKKVAKDKRVLIPEMPLTQNDVFLINKTFCKWKRDYIELEFKDNEFNMCPYVKGKDDLIWKFDTEITGDLIMTKSKFDNWRRATSKFDDSEPRPYEIVSNDDFESGGWYDRDEILKRILKQKAASPVSFVKKRMIPISKIASHLKKRLEKYNLKDEFQEIWRQITESLERMGVTFYTCSGNNSEKYLWYEDFAMIPFIALNTTKFKQSLPWPAIPVNVLLDIPENDYESILRFLNQASLLRSTNRYQHNKSYLSPWFVPFDYNKTNIPEESRIKYYYSNEDIRYGHWINTYNNKSYALVIDAIFNYIKKISYLQEESLEKNKKNNQEEQESTENKFVERYGEWGEYMLKNIKAKTIKQGISWASVDLASPMAICEYTNYVDFIPSSSLLLGITYPLFYFPQSNVLKVALQKFKGFFLTSIKSFKSDFIESSYI